MVFPALFDRAVNQRVPLKLYAAVSAQQCCCSAIGRGCVGLPYKVTASQQHWNQFLFCFWLSVVLRRPVCKTPGVRLLLVTCNQLLQAACVTRRPRRLCRSFAQFTEQHVTLSSCRHCSMNNILQVLCHQRSTSTEPGLLQDLPRTRLRNKYTLIKCSNIGTLQL